MRSLLVVDPAVSAYLALDALSFVLAGTVAAFFWRTHRILPQHGYDVLSLAFGLLGVSYLVIAASIFDLVGDEPALDAFRVGGQFLGAALLFTNYAMRRAGLSVRALHVTAVAVLLAGVVYLGLYFVVPPRGFLPEPLAYLPWLRLLEFGFLIVSSYMVALDVRGRVLADLQVPVAFLLLSLSKYSTALLELNGVEDAVLAPYMWRVVGLVILLRVVWPFKGWPRAPS